MARRVLLPSLVLVAMLMAAAPRDAPAQSVDLNSSMTAVCMNASCSLVRFTLQVPDQGSFANALVDIVRVTSTDLTLFNFAAIEQVWNSGGNLYTNDGVANDTWNPTINSLGAIEIASASGALATDPISILISFSSSTPSALFTGVLTYAANGVVIPSTGGNPRLFSTSGQVTPEPVSLALLGTGLLGVAGAARRKRRRAGAEPESTA